MDETAANLRLRRQLGWLVRLWRQFYRLPQTELAHRAGTSQSAVNVFETGPHDPRLSSIERLFAALGQPCPLRLADPAQGLIVDFNPGGAKELFVHSGLRALDWD